MSPNLRVMFLSVVVLTVGLVPFCHASCPALPEVKDAVSIAAHTVADGQVEAYMIEREKYLSPCYEIVDRFSLFWWNPDTELWEVQLNFVPFIRQMDIQNRERDITNADEYGKLVGTSNLADDYSDPYSTSPVCMHVDQPTRDGQVWEWNHEIGDNYGQWIPLYDTEDYDWVLYHPVTYERMGMVKGFDGLWKMLEESPPLEPGDPWYKYLPAAQDNDLKTRKLWLVDKDAERFAKWEKGDTNYFVTLNRRYGSKPFNIYYYGESEADALENIVDAPNLGSRNVDEILVKHISYDEVEENLWCIDVDGIPWQWDNNGLNGEWIDRRAKSCKTIGGITLIGEDYIYNCDVNGDLIIIDGWIRVVCPGGLRVNGDVKIFSGGVYMGPEAGELQVAGDLIVTSTHAGEHSMVISHSGLKVTGAIITRSDYGEAIVTTTGGGVDGPIEAGSIITRGYENASIYTDADLTVVGEVDTRSTTSFAFVWVQTGTLEAESVKTNGLYDAYVKADDISVIHEINTQSLAGNAYVESEVENIYSGMITTSAELVAYVRAAEGIDVLGDIRTTSITSDAYVYSAMTSITAGSIVTSGYNNGFVTAIDLLLVTGDISTKSAAGHANVVCSDGPIIAANIYTDGYASSHVLANQDVTVRRNINLQTGSSVAQVESTAANIFAYNITTSGYTNGYVEGSDILAGGVIDTSDGSSSYVWSRNGDVIAESIFTRNGTAFVMADDSIVVNDIIKAESADNHAMVHAGDDIYARSISTDADLSGFVRSDNGSIDVIGDIRTNSNSSVSFVLADDDIDARSIKTYSPPTFDNSIKAGPGSGHFKLFVDDNTVTLTIQNSEFYIDADRDWTFSLCILGECTFNGNGHEIVFSQEGAITVSTDSSLLLKNIRMDRVFGDIVKCVDNTATLSLVDVFWTQTNDTNFSNGSMQILGDVVFSGSGTKFLYDTDLTSTIHEDASLIFSHWTTLSYDHDTDVTSSQRLWLLDDTSRIKFDGGMLFTGVDIRFTRGIVALDNLVTVSVGAGTALYLGNDNEDDNVWLDSTYGSEFRMHGPIVNDNVYT